MEDKLFNLLNNEENQTFITYCPVCNLRYDPLEAKVLQEGKNSHLLHIKCRHCKSSILALIVSNNLGLNSIGLITDLSSDDVVKFKKDKVITHDDIIELHQSISKEKALIDYLD